MEVKVSLQSPSGTKKIDSRCLKNYRPSVKKDKNDANWEHQDEVSNKDKEKTKSHNFSSAHQPQTQASKEKQSS